MGWNWVSEVCIQHFSSWELFPIKDTKWRAVPTRWWFQRFFFYLHPYFWKWSNLFNIFSDGLKSPTSQEARFRNSFHICLGELVWSVLCGSAPTVFFQKCIALVVQPCSMKSKSVIMRCLCLWCQGMNIWSSSSLQQALVESGKWNGFQDDGFRCKKISFVDCHGSFMEEGQHTSKHVCAANFYVYCLFLSWYCWCLPYHLATS